MDGYIDQGKIPVAGYLNADPPGEPQFALTAAGSAYANTIQQAGGEVTVDSFGGIGLITPSGSQMGIDTFANIFLSAVSSGTVLIETAGAGQDVNIVNAGTIAFDNFGAGAMTGVQTINGTIYPPPGTGSASITQAGALVACLGSGAITISSIGVGADVEIYNAGTLRFDTMGAGAISGLSTVNGVAYPPASSVPSDLTVSTLTAGSYISTSALQGVSSIVCALDFLLTGTNTAIVGSNYASLLDAGGAGVNVVGGEVRLQGSGYGVKVEGDMNVSTLSGVSSINGVAFPLASIGDIANTYVLTDGTSVTIGGSGSAPGIEVGSDNTVYLGDGVATVNISNLSTINGSAYSATTLGDPAGTFVTADGSYVRLGGNGNPAIEINTGNALTVGSPTANTSIVYASTIQASADGLKMFDTIGNASVKLDTAGTVAINDGHTTATDGTGLTVSGEGIYLSFPLDTTATFGVGAIENVSTINGNPYPIAVRQATYYKSVAQNLTSPNTDVTFDSTGAWNNAGGYITHTNGTTDFTVVQTGLYQLEFSTSILANGGTWTATTKTVFIDITRSPTAETAIIGQSAVINSGANYSQQVSATYYLVAGDVINLRINNTILTGTPTAQGVTTTFDLNTFFTWRFIS